MSEHEDFVRSITERIEEAKQRPAQSLLHVHIIILLGGIRYAIPMASVGEILRTPALTPIPGADPYIQGVFLHRGTIIPVIDISKRFQSGAIASRVPAHVVIIEERHTLYGFLVDHVVDAVEFHPEELQPAGDTSDASFPSPYLLGAFHHTVVAPRTPFRYDFLIASPNMKDRYKEEPESYDTQATTFLLSVARMVESLENDAFGVMVQ